MLIKEISEPIIFIALKRISNYLIDSVWGTSVGTGEIEAEFELAKQRSKKYHDDVVKLAKLDAELDWGHEKTIKGENYFFISNTGNQNPWYTGELSLEELLSSLESVEEFIKAGDNYINDSEFIHYYEFLREYAGISIKSESKSNIFVNIEKLKTLMINVSTGLARIQEVNEEYKNLYIKIDSVYKSHKAKNPNKFSDLWEFFTYWKKYLGSYADRRSYVAKLYKDKPNFDGNKPAKALKNKNPDYVNVERIKELKAIKNNDFDLIKLIKYCQELNAVSKEECFLATAMLVRSMINHISPIFGCNTFSEVANNYRGSKSFKDSMKNLDNSLRKIADSYLHELIRKKEALPNLTQVDFTNDIDVLLQEVYRLLK